MRRTALLEYICNECARARGDIPRLPKGPLRGTPKQKDLWATHVASHPSKPKNGVFALSDTNAQSALLHEAGQNGELEIETGARSSTNVVYGAGRSIGYIEEQGNWVRDADGIRWPNSSRATEPHFYPLATADLGLRICKVCGRTIGD